MTDEFIYPSVEEVYDAHDAIIDADLIPELFKKEKWTTPSIVSARDSMEKCRKQYTKRPLS